MFTAGIWNVATVLTKRFLSVGRSAGRSHHKDKTTSRACGMLAHAWHRSSCWHCGLTCVTCNMTIAFYTYFTATNAPPEWLRQNSENHNRNEKILGRWQWWKCWDSVMRKPSFSKRATGKERCCCWREREEGGEAHWLFGYSWIEGRYWTTRRRQIVWRLS